MAVALYFGLVSPQFTVHFVTQYTLRALHYDSRIELPSAPRLLLRKSYRLAPNRRTAIVPQRTGISMGIKIDRLVLSFPSHIQESALHYLFDRR